MNLNFKEIQDDVLKEIRNEKVSNVDPFRDMVRRHINRVVFECCESMFFEGMCDSYQFTLALNQNIYTLAQDCMGIVNVRLIDTTLTPARAWQVLDESQDEYDEEYPTPINLQVTPTPGQARKYRIVRFDGFMDRTPNVEYRVYSDDARDKSFVTVVGYQDSQRQRPIKIRLQLDGINPVATPSPIPYLITGVGKIDTFGSVTLERAQVPPLIGYTTVCTLSPWERSVYGYSMEFSSIPDKTYTCEVRYKKRPQMMVNDEEVPWGFPPEYIQVIVEGAKFLGLKEMVDETRAGIAKAEFERLKNEMMRYFRPSLFNHAGIRWATNGIGFRGLNE